MMRKIKLHALALGVTLFAPLAAFAQQYSCQANSYASGTVEALICRINTIVKFLIPVLILGAVAWFIVGVIKFMTAHDAEEKGTARSTMIHGIISFAVILGLWGLVAILTTTFTGGQGQGPQGFPTF